MDMEIEKQSYKTKDRFEIYILLSSGCKLKSYEATHPGAVFFEFENKKRCEDILTQLISKRLKVFAHDMISAIRDAQSIFSKYRRYNNE